MDKLRRRIGLIFSAMGPVINSCTEGNELIFAEIIVPMPMLVTAQGLLERYGIISGQGFLKSHAGVERLLLALERRFQTTIVDDGAGEGVVEAPPEMLALAGWG